MREITWLEICPGCECFEPYIGLTSPGVRHREDKHSSFVGGPVRLIGGLLEAWPPLLRSAHPLDCSQGRSRMADWNCTSGCQFPLTIWVHAPAWAEQMLQHHLLYHVTAPQWSDGYYGQGKSLTVSSRGGPDPKWRLSRSGTAITGICIGSVSEEPKLYGWTSTACTPSHAKNFTCWEPAWVLLVPDCSPLGQGCCC